MAEPTNDPQAELYDEPDRLLDHEYDGIHEYDNPLPRWWVLLFVLSTVIAFPYTLYYHFGAGPSVHDNLDAEIEAYAAGLLETYGELKVDEPTILTYMRDDMAMAGMAGVFKGKCAQCHLADGSGNVGPNLTDENWLNVKGVTDIARILEEGLVMKGMPAWSDKLTETQIVLLSSYVARMRENPVSGKPPQGEAIPPWPEAPAPGTEPAEGAVPAIDGDSS